LEIEATQSRQSDVKDDAADNIRKFALQQVRRRRKYLNTMTYRSKEATQCVAHPLVVVNNEDERSIVWPGMLRVRRTIRIDRHALQPDDRLFTGPL